MEKNKIEKTISDNIKPILNNLNYELIECVYRKENKNIFLRVFIDFLKNDENKKITHEDCEKVSKAIENIIEGKIETNFFLEVSSAGIKDAE